VSRINWSTAAQGAQVVPVLLIHGVGIVAVPEGVSITGISLSSVPTAWWPGNTYADFSAYLAPWLRLDGDGLTISERAVPTAAQLLDVSEVTLHLSDVGLAATRLFESADAFDATYLTAEVSATATTIPAASTAAFPSSGIVYLGQEAIRYGAKTSTSFTTCTRGVFGSRATRHLYSVSQGAGLGNPQITSGAPEMTGRPATLWLAQVQSGVIVDVQLEHFGTVGTGVSLMGGGESDEDGYVITLDHAIKRMGQRIRGSAVSVGGFAHPGNLSARTTLETPTTVDLTPIWVVSQNSTSGATTGINLLTGDTSAPDNGGWHPTRESYLAALNAAGASAFPSPATFTAALDGDNLTITVGDFSPHETVTAQTAWATTVGAIQRTGGRPQFPLGEMPKAWVPITEGSPVYLTASDYAAIPPAPSSTAAQFVLIFGDDDDRASKRYARITAQGTSGSASFVTCTALRAPTEVRLVGMYNGLARSTTRPGGTTAAGFVVQEPTTARLGLYVSSNSWVEALRLVVESLDTEYACVADAIDWTHMRAVADAYPSAFTTRREIVVDLNTTLLAMLQNEAALGGFALVMHEGRVSIARIAEFATTEITAGTITDADLDATAPSPTYEKGSDGIVNTYTIVSPDDGVTVNVSDQTSRALYGGQGVITATLPRSVVGTPQDASRLYVQVFAQAVSVLGPLRYPYRHVTVQVPLNLYDYQIGDLLSVTLWRVPDGLGARGITEAVAQVVARSVVLFGDQTTGHVAYTVRLNPRNLQGYAPAALAAAGGIAGAVITLDTTTISTGGFAGAGYTDGGASTFTTGDLVRLVEIDTTSPTASTQHTVTGVSGATLTLSPAPSATFAGLAASALKVMVVYDDWGVVVAGGRTTQQRFAYLALADATLDADHAARVFAA